MGISVGSKLFSAALAGKAIDGTGSLPDLIPILIPPFSSAGVVAKMTLPASFRLFQKSAAVPAHTEASGHSSCHVGHVESRGSAEGSSFPAAS